MEDRVLTLPVLNGAKTVKNRDDLGRFVPGTAPGPGRPKNPFARRQAAMRQAVQDEVTDADVGAVVRKLVELAKGGDLGACRLVFEWIIGEVPSLVHPDHLDADELRVQQAAPSPMEQMRLAEDPATEPGGDAAADSWQTFAKKHVEWGASWAVPLTYLYEAYRDWCLRQDEPVWPQAEIEAWLTQQGATVRGGDWPAVLGLRVVE